MPKHTGKKAALPKQHRNSNKPYQRNAPKAAVKKTQHTQQHRQTAATLVKALGSHGINSLLMDTATELQEKGIKQTRGKAGSKQQQQPDTIEQQQLQQQQQQQPPQQQQPVQVAPRQNQPRAEVAQSQPDITALLSGWSMKQQSEAAQQGTQ